MLVKKSSLLITPYNSGDEDVYFKNLNRRG